MKKLSSWLSKLNNKHFLLIWLIFHAAVFVSFFITFAVKKGNLKIDANLMTMLPSSLDDPDLAAANNQVSEQVSDKVYVLVSNPDFDKAKSTAIQVYDQLKDSPKFNSISIYSDMSNLGEVQDFLFNYRWNLLDEKGIAQINSPDGEYIFAEDALASVYGAFNMTSLDNLERDPFMLNEYSLNVYLGALEKSGTGMTMKDGVLAGQYEGRWYVLIQGILSKAGLKLASKSNAVAQIYSVCNPLEDGDTRFIYSGTPFHSYKSSSEASTEITIISIVSLLAVIIILFLIFRSPIPILFSVASILLSIGTAICATLNVFMKMHLITFIFGTSLIGSCIDYSLHYFINWKANSKLATGTEIREHLLKGLSLSLVSTVICYALMLFAPYNMIKQMGFFSIVGLISSFLTTIAVYPFLSVPKKDRHLKLVVIMKKPKWWNKKKIGRTVISCFFVIPLILIAFLVKNAVIKNDLNSLYKMEGRLLDDQIEAGNVLKFYPYGWFLVEGKSAEEVLLTEENVTVKLDQYKELKGEKLSYVCTSTFIPSIKKQKESYNACKKLIAISDYQMDALGYGPEETEALIKEFKNAENKYISLQDGNIPAFIADSIGMAWIGQINEKYYSVIIPTESNDVSFFREVANNYDNVHYLNTMADVSDDLDTLTAMILIFFVAAFAILFIVLRFFYGTKHTAKIISVPVLIIIMISCVFSVAKIHLEFFSIVGMVLVMGLGMDYIIYMIENEHKSLEMDETQVLEPFGILLSFVTTSISFGALALSRFTPVHYIGLSIFIGLITAYFSSFFYDRS